MAKRVELTPGDYVGFIGGGQLAAMGIDACRKHRFIPYVYASSTQDCAVSRASGGVSTSFEDPKGSEAFARFEIKVASPEWENVPQRLIEALEGHGVPVFPNAHAFEIASNRKLEKAYLQKFVSTTAWIPIEREDDLLQNLGAFTPGILKTQGSGYDGKGQVAVNVPEGVPYAWDALGKKPCILEKKMKIAFETSVVGVRGQDGKIVHFPLTRNGHRDGILRYTHYLEGAIPRDIENEAVHVAHAILEDLDVVGVFTIEFFVDDKGNLFGNEMAPRVHNSGHWTMDGCNVSQFDLWVHALAGMPLVQPKALYRKVVMMNLLQGIHVTPQYVEKLTRGGGIVHLYGKTPPEEGKLRKIGHVNFAEDKLP